MSRYSYTWNSGTSKCQSCKDTTVINNTVNNTTTSNTTTGNGYYLRVTMVLALIGFLG